MILKKLFDALDAQPFRPVTVELMSGKRVRVRHPENVFIIPGRHKASLIHVYDTDEENDTLFYPEGIVAIEVERMNGKGR